MSLGRSLNLAIIETPSWSLGSQPRSLQYLRKALTVARALFLVRAATAMIGKKSPSCAVVIERSWQLKASARGFAETVGKSRTFAKEPRKSGRGGEI